MSSGLSGKSGKTNKKCWYVSKKMCDFLLKSGIFLFGFCTHRGKTRNCLDSWEFLNPNGENSLTWVCRLYVVNGASSKLEYA